MGGLISNQDHFGNLDEFDHIQDLLPITSSEVTVATPRDTGIHLKHYNDQVMYGYNNEQSQLLDYFYHSANALGGDQEDTFAHHHWMIDSGCTDHLSPFEDDFIHLGTQMRYATVANGQQVSMHEPGKVVVQQCIKGKILSILTLQEVWFAPHAANQLLSVPMLTKQGYKCAITHNASRIWNTKGQLVIQASALSPTNNLYWFQSLMITPMNGVLSSLAGQDSYDLWHTRFGHLSKNALRQAPLHVTGLPTIPVPVSSPSCKGCAMGKMADRPFLSFDKRAARSLALVHTDLIGPMPVEPCSRAKYVLTFIDDHSGYALVAFIRNKDATAQHFQSMACWAETFTGQSLTSVCSDRGGEFLGKELQMFFLSRGITHQTSVPHTPQQNGCAERFNRTLLEKAEAIQQHACLPRSFWQDAVETTLHIYN